MYDTACNVCACSFWTVKPKLAASKIKTARLRHIRHPVSMNDIFFLHILWPFFEFALWFDVRWSNEDLQSRQAHAQGDQLQGVELLHVTTNLSRGSQNWFLEFGELGSSHVSRIRSRQFGFLKGAWECSLLATALKPCAYGLSWQFPHQTMPGKQEFVLLCTSLDVCFFKPEMLQIWVPRTNCGKTFVPCASQNGGFEISTGAEQRKDKKAKAGVGPQ